jgi:hypothetical protein
MITNTGKAILAKYLVGQAPAYASYIAIGCGEDVRSGVPGTLDAEDLDEYLDKKSLTFETIRSPIISRGYVVRNLLKSDGTVQTDVSGNPIKVSEIVFTAELPTEERYEITEIGVFSAGSNPSAGAYDSKLLYAFSQAENWQYKDGTSQTSLPIVARSLDVKEEGTDPSDEDQGNIIFDENDEGESTVVAFQANADNSVFAAQERLLRNERARFLNNIVFARGNMSVVSNNNGVLSVGTTPHILLNTDTLTLDKNAPTDEIKLAFSVINKVKTPVSPSPSNPDEVRLYIKFSSGDIGSESYAAMSVVVTSFDNRYFVVTKQLQELETSGDFSWSQVRVVRVYAQALVDQGTEGSPDLQPSDQFYIGMDAIRLENVSTENPLYGLTGYAVVQTLDGLPVVKEANTTNYVEFRYQMDVV